MKRTFKRCANPRCKRGPDGKQKWFWGPDNKLYCCNQCRRNVSMQKYRKKTRVKEIAANLFCVGVFF